MGGKSLYHTYQRYKTLQTHRISALPVVILMPHSACNCRCAMCDIWKDNKNLKQLTEQDISGLLGALKKYGTQEVVMSGGEALLNANFFALCNMLRAEGIKVTLLSTGLLLKKHANDLVKNVNEIIISLDGDEVTHDRIRNIEGAYSKLREGIQSIRHFNPKYRITARTVVHRLNFRSWPAIIDAAKELGVNQVSFLPADVSSQAFNREVPWGQDRQHEILIDRNELSELQAVIGHIISNYSREFDEKFIAESREKLQKIYAYYSAFYGLNAFPYKKCNAPWVSTVIEADGSVRPCFFHDTTGNIRDGKLEDILNSPAAIKFRRQLDMDTNETCIKCVCYLNLSPLAKIS